MNYLKKFNEKFGEYEGYYDELKSKNGRDEEEGDFDPEEEYDGSDEEEDFDVEETDLDFTKDSIFTDIEFDMDSMEENEKGEYLQSIIDWCTSKIEK